METTEDTEGIMENAGNGSTEVVHFERCFKWEKVVLTPFIKKISSSSANFLLFYINFEYFLLNFRTIWETFA